jgi:hypothetical protein
LFYLVLDIHTAMSFQLLLAPRNTNQVRNAKKNAKRKNGQMDSLALLQYYANEYPDCRWATL